MAFSSIVDQLALAEPGSPVDVSKVSDPDTQGLLRALVLDDRPLPPWSDMERRMLGKRLDHEIDDVEAQLHLLESGTEPHSETLRHLIALQQEKRSIGET
jgi:hypothetical protein